MNIIRKLRALSSERDQLFHGGVVARYNIVIPFIEGKDVLDIGSGLGFGANYLVEHKARKVMGIDYSEAAVECARKSFSAENLEFVVMDATNISFPDECFDVIIAYEIIEHLPVRYHGDFLRSATRLLKRGGIFFISTPRKKYTSYYVYHTKEFNPLELKELLSRYFSDVSLKGLRFVNDEYLKMEEKMKRALIYRLISVVGRSRLARDLSSFFPLWLRRKVSGEDQLPKTVPSDFIVSDELNACDELIALCGEGICKW